MPQSHMIVLALGAGFLVFITARGNLGDYIRLLV